MAKVTTTPSGNLRAPIVVVLGHVDHGKTTLLDRIRKTNVQEKEAGGITQSIGASVIKTKEGKKITFIDTPGHAAFANMRSHGAKVADIAILVVAAHGGIKPQTKESLSIIRDAGIPYIVAATKIDLPSALVETVSEQLKKEGIKFEDQGGDVPLVPVSGKTGEGVDNLIEMISLISEVNEIKADADGELEAVVIETHKDKRGPLVSVVVRNGTLGVGDQICTDSTSAKVRGLFDDKGKSVKIALPGDPALILGFSRLPLVGSRVSYQEGNQAGKAQEQKTPFSQRKIEEGQIPVVLKAGNSGSLEAILANLPKEIVPIFAGVGDVIENDIFLAKSTEQAYIFAFESKVSPQVKKLAMTEGVVMETFNVIYELFDRFDELVKKGQEEVLGKAEIVDSFPYNNKKVAGSKVVSGEIGKKDKLVIMRGDKELGQVRVASLKREKKDIDKAKAGEEFGIVFTPQLDFDKGDMILSIR